MSTKKWKYIRCPKCNGAGGYSSMSVHGQSVAAHTKECTRCCGAGEVRVPADQPVASDLCDECGGTGELDAAAKYGELDAASRTTPVSCTKCSGTGEADR